MTCSLYFSSVHCLRSLGGCQMLNPVVTDLVTLQVLFAFLLVQILSILCIQMCWKCLEILSRVFITAVLITCAFIFLNTNFSFSWPFQLKKDSFFLWIQTRKLFEVLTIDDKLWWAFDSFFWYCPISDSGWSSVNTAPLNSPSICLFSCLKDFFPFGRFISHFQLENLL